MTGGTTGVGGMTGMIGGATGVGGTTGFCGTSGVGVRLPGLTGGVTTWATEGWKPGLTACAPDRFELMGLGETALFENPLWLPRNGVWD